MIPLAFFNKSGRYSALLSKTKAGGFWLHKRSNESDLAEKELPGTPGGTILGLTQ